MAGGDFAAPVDREAECLQLAAHGGDVVVGPRLRMNLSLHRGVLGRQAEGVPTHRVQDVEALGHFVAGHHVTHGVVADMAHMDAPRRIGEHLQHVVFRLVARRPGSEAIGLGPSLLPLGLGLFDVVTLDGHGSAVLRRAEIGAGYRSNSPGGASLSSLSLGIATAVTEFRRCAAGAPEPESRSPNRWSSCSRPARPPKRPDRAAPAGTPRPGYRRPGGRGQVCRR